MSTTVAAPETRLSSLIARVRERRARRPRGPRRQARLTREGKAFVFVTVGVGIAAVNTGNNLLYLMLGLMLSLLLLSMVLSELALMRVRMRRRMPQRAFANTMTLVEFVLTNEKRFLPSYSLEVEDRAEGQPTDRRCYFLKVGPKGEQVASYRRVPTRRGTLTLVGYRVGTRYPFGLVEKAYVHDGEDEMLVFPALVPVAAADLRGLEAGDDSPRGRVGMGTEIAGLREYRTGDEARSIHWRRSAALGRMVVRERELDASARITLVLDNAPSPSRDPRWAVGFELAISRAASLAAMAARRGAAVDVAVRGARSPLVLPGAPPDPVWAFLARLDIADPGEPAPDGGPAAVPVPVPIVSPAPDTEDDAARSGR